MEFNVLVDSERLEDFAIIPITEQRTLDESLDQGYIRLNYTSKESAYRPFTNVDIEITDDFGNTRELNYFIASDNKTEIIANGTFNHELLLIEQSKWLERFLSGTKTVTNPLIHDYLGMAGDVYVRYSTNAYAEHTEWRYDDRYESIIDIKEQQTLQLYSANQMFDTGSPNIQGSLKLTKNKGKDDEETTTYGYYDRPTITLSLAEYTFLYRHTWQEQPPGTFIPINYYEEMEFTINVIDQNQEPKPNKTITDAVNDLLATIETLRESETPRFSFNQEQAEKYSSVESPEFTLTGTLWEALRQIGSYIHAIPRLKHNVIYFDELGGDEKMESQLTDYSSNAETFNIEQYASAIDSTIQNIVNLDDIDEGAIVEPYLVGYKTPRTDTGVVQITEDDMFIQTKEPIEQIVKVEVGYLSDESIVGDITPYVYESAEYDALSSYEDNYPYAKAYAIKYTIGQKNITGLNFKRESIYGSVFENYSIKNIISRVTGKPITIIEQLFGGENMLKLQFRVTYIPITTARARQVKPYTKDLQFESSLAFNQSAQKISSRAYGEAMKNAIARLGNPEVTKTYIINDLSKIPKPGQLFNEDYYISVIKCEYYRDFVRMSLALSKDFNKINEYVGINSEIRFYEISEKQASDRYVLYEDYCVFGDYADLIEKSQDTYGNSLITANAIELDFIYIERDSFYSMQSAVVKGDDNPYVMLPITRYALGNSMIFTFHYDDNYSAGEKVIQDRGTTIQNQVRYTDEYGEIKTLYISYIATPPIEEQMNYALSVEEGNSLPNTEVFDRLHSSYAQATTGDDGIDIRKDNREKIIFTYQIHFVSDDKKIVIGSLPRRNGLMAATTKIDFSRTLKDRVYILQDEIPRFAKSVDLTNATLVDYNKTTYTEIRKNNEIIGYRIAITEVPVNGKAWAIASTEGELLIGGNKEFYQYEGQEVISFVFTRKIN